MTRKKDTGTTPPSAASFKDSATPPFIRDPISGYRDMTETFGKNHKYGSEPTPDMIASNRRENTRFRNPSEEDLESDQEPERPDPTRTPRSRLKDIR